MYYMSLRTDNVYIFICKKVSASLVIEDRENTSCIRPFIGIRKQLLSDGESLRLRLLFIFKFSSLLDGEFPARSIEE